ncbi:gustatory receptor 59e [Musca autumnalis]|uniref:gustatory receptor 59e n=1 Tax=Musca autumnalis TaxID=221902 RepID=UPI003CEAA369
MGWGLIRPLVAYNLPNVLINFNLCLYWLLLRFIALLLQWINSILECLPHCTEEAVEESTILMNPTTLWFHKEFYGGRVSHNVMPLNVHDIFLIVKQINSDLCNALTDTVEIFRIILVLNFLTSFLVLTIEFFSLYKYFDNPSLNELMLVVFKFVWLMLHISRLFFVLLTNNAITQKKCRTLYILNATPLEIFESENYINQFLLQIMVRKHTETACGIIDLDLMFLLGIINALAMYIIFLIQSDLGNVSLSGTSLNITTN